jgi:4-amino-4-deoxychorismate lyase
MKISINGNIVNREEAVVSVYDHGFLYGMGLFETFRSYDGQFPLLELHYRRLNESAEDWGLAVPFTLLQLQTHLKELLTTNQCPNAYIRLSLSAGIEELGLPSGRYQNCSWIVYIKPLPDLPSPWFTEGRDLYLLHQNVRSVSESNVRRKSFHYANSIFAKWELGDRLGEGIFLTPDGYLAEGIVSNLFFVRDDVLYTPSIQTGILPGVTREVVIRLARDQGMDLNEGKYEVSMLNSADEAFVTNSIMEIVPACRIDGEPIGTGLVGSITGLLSEAYRKYIRS